MDIRKLMLVALASSVAAHRLREGLDPVLRLLDFLFYFANLVTRTRFYGFALVIPGNIIHLGPTAFARLKLLPGLFPFRFGGIRPRVRAEKRLLCFAQL